MFGFEFHSQNRLLTTTTFTASTASNNTNASYLIDRRRDFRWGTSGFGSDTTATITFTLSTASVANTLILLNHNLRSFNIAFTGGPATFTVAGNSDSSTYFTFASATVSNIIIQLTRTFPSDDEKRIGEILLVERQVAGSNTSFQNFDYKIDRKQIVHKMSDGGVSVYNINDVFKAKINYSYISTSYKDSLKNIFDTGTPFNFIALGTSAATIVGAGSWSGTSAGWVGSAYETNWMGDFNFYFNENYAASGWRGSINLEQTNTR